MEIEAALEQATDSRVDYKKYALLYSKLQHSKLLPIVGTQTVTLTNSAGLESQFQLPISAFNLAQSYLNFDITPQAVAGTTNFVEADCPCPIRQIQLYTVGGTMIADLNEVANACQVMWKPETLISEFKDYDSAKSVNGTTTNTYYSRYLFPNRNLQNMQVRPDNTAVQSLDEPAYFFVGVGQNKADPVIKCKLPMKAIKNSIFETDASIMLPEILILRVVWQGTQKIAWNATNGGDPTAGAAAYDATKTIKIDNLSFMLAMEHDKSIVSQLQGAIASKGMSIPYKTWWTSKQSLTGGSVGITQRINRGQGTHLRRIYHTLFPATETGNNMYAHSNLSTDGQLTPGGNLVTQYYTALNNERRQQFNVDCQALDDYAQMQKSLEGSLILNSNVFSFNWFLREIFDNYKGPSDKNLIQEHQLIQGIPLDVEQKWDAYLTIHGNNSGNNLNHYTFIITQRMLHIGPGGVRVE
jgi:hypothetical protein